MPFCFKKIGKTVILPFLPFGTPLNFMNKRKWIILMHKSVATAELCAKCRQHTLVPVFPSDFHMLIVGVSSAKNWGHCSGLIYARVPLQLKSKFPHSNFKPRPFKLLTKHWRTSKQQYGKILTINAYFNKSHGSRPVECDVIGCKKCRYSKVTSSRPVYYSILNHFRGLLTVMC